MKEERKSEVKLTASFFLLLPAAYAAFTAIANRYRIDIEPSNKKSSFYFIK